MQICPIRGALNRRGAAFPTTHHHWAAAANPAPARRAPRAAPATPPFQSNDSAPMGEPQGPPGRDRRHHGQLIGQLPEVTGPKANENAVPGRGWVTCLKRGLRPENDFPAGNSGSPSSGSHASDDCESLGPELTHGDGAHNCIPKWAFGLGSQLRLPPGDE